MTLSRLIPIAALATFSVFLAAAFLFLLLRDGGDQPLELTDNAAATATAVSDRPIAAVSENPAAGDTGDAAEPLRVYVAGAVQKPGVYTLNPGDRLADAVSAAGGIAATADLSPVNLALKVKDEGRYLIPDISAQSNRELPAALPADAGLTLKTANLLTGELSGVTAAPEPAETTAAVAADNADNNAPGPIDLNTAGRPQLESLPGIGPSRAQAIIAYREQNGPFLAAEELTAVSGIGSGIYENLQSLITVQPAP